MTYDLEKKVKGQCKVNGITPFRMAVLDLVGIVLGITFLSLPFSRNSTLNLTWKTPIPGAILGVLGQNTPKFAPHVFETPKRVVLALIHAF